MQTIETECPNCHAPYRLKDRMVGKPVTCATPSCRKTFVVAAKLSTNGAAAETLPGSTATPPSGVPAAVPPKPPEPPAAKLPEKPKPLAPPVPPPAAKLSDPTKPPPAKPPEPLAKPVAKVPEPAVKPAPPPAPKPPEPAVKPVAKTAEKPALPPPPPKPAAKPPEPAAKASPPAAPKGRPGITVIPPKPTAPPKKPKSDDDDDALGSIFTDPPPSSAGPMSLNTRAFAELMAAEKAEVPAEPPPDQRVIQMTCRMCDHVWDVGFDKQGKNAPCPECRSINKVPEQKQKENWREAGTKLPSLVKQEKLEGVVSVGDSKYVSGEALRQGGALGDEFEPRPRWHYAAVAATVLGVLGGGFFAITSVKIATKQDKVDQFVTEGRDDLVGAKDSPLPPAVGPLYRAAYHLAAAEYCIRASTEAEPKKLHAAREHFDSARQELSAAPKSGDRDALFAELLAAQVALGGTPEQAIARTRGRWTPKDQSAARARIREDDFDVQSELRKTLTAMRKDDRPAEFDARTAAVRRATRELCAAKQPDVIGGIFAQAFFPHEVAEASAQVAAEIFRATADKDRLRAAAEQMKPTGPAAEAPPLSPTAAALCLLCDPPVTGVKLPPPPADKGEISEPTRQAYTALRLLQNKPAEAFEVANRPGKPDARLRALALVAEWSSAPTDAVKAAAEEAKKSAGKKEVGPLPAGPLVRLAQTAAKSGPADAVDPLLAGIPDENLRAWAKADVFRIRLTAAADRKPAEEAALDELPVDPKKLTLGHAWGRLALARQNAGTVPDPRAAYDRWGKPVVGPFGLVGHALGLQDAGLR